MRGEVWTVPPPDKGRKARGGAKGAARGAKGAPTPAPAEPAPSRRPAWDVSELAVLAPRMRLKLSC
jgi:hypothetical protein